jgi:methyl-accepting chemotaxis protein
MLLQKKFEEAGFVYVVNKEGIVLNHINSENVFKNLNKNGDKETNAIQDIIQKQNKFLKYKLMGINGWIYYMPYEAMNWSIIATLPYNQFMKSINNFIFYFIIITILSLILSFIFVNVITNKITKELGLVTDKIEKISEGEILELEKINTIQKKDEIGILINSFNNMLDSLNYKVDIIRQIADKNNLSVNIKTISEHDILGKALSKMITSLNIILTQVNNTSVQINLKADQVAHTSQYLSQGATEQASTLEEITSSIVEISNQSKQNFKNAENGNNQMKDLITAMKNINKSADEIKKIVKVIDDIAFQTNMLALNANIEAARAGKYGKGFGVVAEEVRNLASRSTIRVKDTTKMVEEAMKNIDIGNNLVETTAKQLEEIVFGSKEQTERLDQINNGLSQIEQVTQNNLASAEESASAAEEFASQSELLKSMIMQFKLKDIYQ